MTKAIAKLVPPYGDKKKPIASTCGDSSQVISIDKRSCLTSDSLESDKHEGVCDVEMMSLKNHQAHSETSHWSFQMYNVTKDDRYTVLSSFHNPIVKKANPFLQGDSGGWLMVEFWTKDRDLVDAAAYCFFKSFELEFQVGEWTRQELGL